MTIADLLRRYDANHISQCDLILGLIGGMTKGVYSQVEVQMALQPIFAIDKSFETVFNAVWHMTNLSRTLTD